MANTRGGKRKRTFDVDQSQIPNVRRKEKKPKSMEIAKPKKVKSQVHPSTSEEQSKNKYRYDEEDMFYGRINQNSRLAYVKAIEKVLTTTDWMRVLDGPFGNIVKMMQGVKFSSQLVHHLLFRQVDSPKKWETWYEVDENLCRFSIKEFCLITGLNCDTLNEEETSGDKRAMMSFFDKKSIKVSEVFDKFKDAREDSTYKLKLALLLLVDGVLLGGDKSRNIRSAQVRLIQNMDRFKKFLWGRLAYEEETSVTTLPRNNRGVTGALKC